MKNAALLAGLAAAAFVFSGCASAPSAELDQANHTATLMSAFNGEMREFRRVQAVIAQQRIDSMKRIRTRIAAYQADDAFDERAAAMAGQDQRANLFKQLRELSDSRARDEQDFNKALSELDAQMDSLLSPLPDVGPALESARKQLAILGDDLPAKDRVEATAQFAKDVKKAVDDNRQKIKDAEEAAKAKSTVTQP